MTRQTFGNVLVHLVVIVMTVLSLLDLDAEALLMQGLNRLASSPPQGIEVIRDCTEVQHTQRISAITTIAVVLLFLTAAAVVTLTAFIAVVVKMLSATVNNSGAARAFLAVTTAFTSVAVTVHAAVVRLETLVAILTIGATAIIFRLLTSMANLGVVIRNERTIIWWHIRNLFLLG